MHQSVQTLPAAPNVGQPFKSTWTVFDLSPAFAETLGVARRLNHDRISENGSE
jgi:hypothetical protein